MNKQFEIIENKLNGYEQFKSAELDRIKKDKPAASSSNAEHIFYDLIGFLAKDDKQLEVRLLYYFHAYQECLSFCRANSMTLATAKLDFIEKNLLFDMDPKSNLGMEAIFFPMKAFYFHKIKKYDEAVQLLEQSIQRFDLLTQHKFLQAEDAMLEQELNICRVFLQSGKHSEAIAAVGKLTLHLDHNIKQKSAKENAGHDAIHYFINSVLHTCLGSEQKKMVGLFSEVIRNFLAMEACGGKNAPAYYRLLEAWLKNQKEIFIFILCSEMETLFRSPGMVQLLLIAYLIVITAESDYPGKMELCDLAARYSKDVIRIESEKFQKILSATINQQKVLK